jgi:hypothetical protein
MRLTKLELMDEINRLKGLVGQLKKKLAFERLGDDKNVR